jgi:site-specific recombinase XerD
MPSHSIHKVLVRRALSPRREPYWAAPLAQGRYIGFRKIDNERGSWIARARAEDGRQQYRALGAFTAALDYDAARKAAQDWFSNLDAGIAHRRNCTVEEACKEYVADRLTQKGFNTANDAEWRFKRSVYGTRLGGTPLVRLRTPALKAWREDLKLTKSGANRMMATLRAALNLAVENRRVPAAASLEWRAVRQYAGADRRREGYLDLLQRRALLAAAAGGVRDLIEAALLTGARPGELAAAPCSAFDSRTKTLTLRGKTGTRTVPLSPVAVTLFERLSASKSPSVPLLTREDGKPWRRAEWTEPVRLAAEAAVFEDAQHKIAKLPAGVCLYSCRHSYITQAIVDGLTTLDVAKLTGTSLATIDRHYGHLVQTSTERLAKVQML